MKMKQLTMSFIGTIIRGVVLVIAILLIYKAGAKAYDFGFRIFTEKPMSEAPGRDVEVTISQDEGLSDVSKMLEEKGLIRDAQLFMIQKKLSQYSGNVLPGMYTLNTSMTAEEISAVISEKNDEGEESLSQPDKLQEADQETSSEPTPLENAGDVVSPIDQTIPDDDVAPAEDTAPAEDGGEAAE